MFPIIFAIPLGFSSDPSTVLIMAYTSAFVCGQIYQAFNSGEKVKAIAKEFNVTPKTVYNIVKKIKSTGNARPRPKTGRPHRLTKADRKFAVLQLDRGHASNATDLQRKYFPHVHPDTVRRALFKEGLIPAIRRVVPLLTPTRKRMRRIWARFVESWTEEYWKVVIFSDETKINLVGSDGHSWCWRRPGDANQARYLVESKKHGGGSLIVWGCITYNGVGRLHRITGIMRATDYVEILNEDLLGTLKDYHIEPGTFFYQQDKDAKHTARVTTAWFSKMGIKTLPWPSQSPDLNIIEHLWDHLKRKIRARDPQPETVEQLWEVTLQEWQSIDKEFIRRLYRSLPKRVAEVKKAKGGNTSY